MSWERNRVGMTGSERTQESLNTPTKKLFKAIDDENLENFKQALKDHPEDWIYSTYIIIVTLQLSF